MSLKYSLTTLFVLLLLLVPVSAQGGGAGMKFNSEIVVHANGDASLHLVMKLPPAQYSQLKARIPNPFNFLRDFTSNRADSEIGKGAQCRYDDSTTSFVMDITELGAVRNLGGGQWEMRIDEGAEYVMQGAGKDGQTAVHFYEAKQQDDGSMLQGKHVYRIPKGATAVAWDAGSRTISYQLAAPKGEGAGRLKMDLAVKSRLMTCVYKTYGLGQTSGDSDEISAQWVAKSVLRNVGKNTITDLRVRYRVAGYSEWSPWQKFAEMAPGQTAVSVYYPVLDQKMAEIRTNTPANVLVEWKWIDGRGKDREDSDGKRVTLLGVNEFVFSNLLRGNSTGTWHDNFNNAPLLAAWVSRNDPVVKQFAAMANRIAGGVGASSSVEDALKALQGCYEMMLRNDFTYQHPPSLTDASVSFEPARVQNVKFPRDVIRDRSGTCIDLAILYASMANAIGLETYLCVVPGHCFPVFKMPNGVLVGFESTGIGGGLRGKSYPFDAMLKNGMGKLAKARKTGLFYLVDLQKLWTRGVSNPELPALPADILQKWNIVESRTAAQPNVSANVAPTRTQRPAQQRPAQQRPAQQRPAPQRPAPQPRQQAQRLEGMWGGKLTETLDSGHQVTYLIGVQIKAAGNGKYSVVVVASGSIPTANGNVEVALVEGFVASIKNGALTGAGVKKILTYVATGAEENIGPMDSLRITRNGAGLMARVGNDEEGYDNISLTFIKKLP